MQNPNQSAQQQLSNTNLAINHSFSTNPLLQNMESMNSCPYYLVGDRDSEPRPVIVQKQTQQTHKNANESNSYYIIEDQLQEKPVFQNTDIRIKKKDKKPLKTKPKQDERPQEYINLSKAKNGDYHRMDGSSSKKGCCDDCCTQKCLGQCCTDACIHCALQVCLQCLIECICQAFK